MSHKGQIVIPSVIEGGADACATFDGRLLELADNQRALEAIEL